MLEHLREETEANKPVEVKGNQAAPDSLPSTSGGRPAVATAKAPAMPTPKVVVGSAKAQPTPVKPAARTQPAKEEEENAWDTGWKFVGHVQRGLAVFDSKKGIVVLDRRSAHQRILYEKLEQQYLDQKVPAQQLLLPVSVELDALGSSHLLDHLEFLNQSGFRLSEFGRNFFRIEAVPVWTTPEEAESLILDLVGLMKDGKMRKDKPVEAFDQIARLACAKSVRLDDSVSEREMVSLVSQLFQCKNPLISPLGKPTYFEMGKNELDRRFMK